MAFNLFCIMAVLAAIPSANVALVVTRSATLGTKDGVAVSIGIVLGDLLFATLAILGMTALANALGAFFSVFKYLGGAYLIWFGVQLLRSRHSLPRSTADTCSTSLLTSLASGFFLTLGDVKAILFYASLFPSLINLANLRLLEIGVILTITIVAVGGVKVAYALAANRIVSKFGMKHTQGKTAAGALMIGTGAYVITKA